MDELNKDQEQYINTIKRHCKLSAHEVFWIDYKDDLVMIENQNNRVAMAASTRSQPFLRALEIIDTTYYKTLICKNINCIESGICSYLDIRAHGNGNNNTKKRVWCNNCQTSKTIDRIFLRPNEVAF